MLLVWIGIAFVVGLVGGGAAVWWWRNMDDEDKAEDRRGRFG